MGKSATIRVRIDPGLKDRAEGIIGKLGMSASQAITLFYRQIELRNGLPLDLSLPAPNAETARALDEAAKGKNLTVCSDENDLYARLGIP